MNVPFALLTIRGRLRTGGELVLTRRIAADAPGRHHGRRVICRRGARSSPWAGWRSIVDVPRALYRHALVHEYAHTRLCRHADRSNQGISQRRDTEWLLPFFVASLAVLNWGRWSAWDFDGFLLYLTHPIMQTTFYDFGWVARHPDLVHPPGREEAPAAVLVHLPDVSRSCLQWDYCSTLWMRHRKLSRSGAVPPPGRLRRKGCDLRVVLAACFHEAPAESGRRPERIPRALHRNQPVRKRSARIGVHFVMDM